MNKIKIIVVILMLAFSLISNAKSISDFDKEVSKLNFEEQKKLFSKYMNSGSNKNDIYPFLGYMYYHGIGVSKNEKAAVNIYERTVEEGSIKGYFLLGKHLIETSTDINKGLTYLIEASDKGLVEATLYIGKIYKEGIGVNKDEYYSNEYYYKAAADGSAEAKFIIAQDLLKSIESSKKNKGLKILTNSADEGYLEACRQLKDLYLNKNNIVEQDLKKHFNYLLCIADNDDLEAIQKVAEYYATGFIVMVNNKEAYEYYKEYVKLVKDPLSIEEQKNYYKAAIAYIKFKKYYDAVNILVKISEKGHSEASNVLGRLYESGYVGKADNEKSLKYYEIAKSQGFDNEEDILRVKKNINNIKK